jgi:hypothetical protein
MIFFLSSMVIDDLHISRSRRPLRPFKANPPLIVDADAVLALAVTGQRLKAVAWQRGKVPQACGRFKPI